MLIAHITDSHIEIPEPSGAGRIADFERVVADINSLGDKPDVVIHSGDISHCNQKTEYRFARSLLERLHMAYYVIPGNKDRRGNMATIFGLDEGFLHQTISTNDWQFVLLDTLSLSSNKGAFCQDRQHWLTKVLETNDKPMALFMHHPAQEMSNNPYPFQFESHKQAGEFEKLVASFRQVKGIFCGHSHRTTNDQLAGIPAMTLTAMSQDRRKGDYPPEYDGRPVYQLIDFAKDGSFDCQIRICR